MKIKLKKAWNWKDIKLKRAWDWEDIRVMCLDEYYCRLVTYNDYNRLKNYIEEHPSPTDKDIYKVAKDIKKHWFCKEETVTDIMSKIANNIVKYIYEVEE